MPHQNLTERKIYHNKYYQEHKGKWKESRIKNADKIKDRKRKYWSKNKDHLNKKRRGNETIKIRRHKYNMENKDKIKLYNNSKKEQKKYLYLLKTYNLTKENYEQLISTQNGKCAICGKLTEKFDTDHDHITGRVRGLLCHSCNLLLGNAGDNIEILLNAIKYLEEAKA